MNVQEISVEQLESNPFQYRTHFPEAEMAELVASVVEVGVLQPIQVRPVKGKKHAGILYQIVAGERRWRASQAAHLKTIPAIVKPMTDIEALTVAIIENTQREDPDDWATAMGIKSLMDMHAESGAPLSLREVAKKLNKSLGYVNNHLGLFKLRPSLQEVAQRHSNVKSSLFEIEKVKDPETERDLISAIDGGASFSTIKSRVDEHLQNKQWKRDSQTPDAETASRAGENARTGGGNVSRGRLVKGNTAREALEAVEEALQSAEWKAETIEHWYSALTEAQRAKLTPRLKRLGKRFTGIEP